MIAAVLCVCVRVCARVCLRTRACASARELHPQSSLLTSCTCARAPHPASERCNDQCPAMTPRKADERVHAWTPLLDYTSTRVVEERRGKRFWKVDFVRKLTALALISDLFVSIPTIISSIIPFKYELVNGVHMGYLSQCTGRAGEHAGKVHSMLAMCILY